MNTNRSEQVTLIKRKMTISERECSLEDGSRRSSKIQ